MYILKIKRIASIAVCVSCAIFMLGLASCGKGKTTYVKGVVVDKVTGEPVERVQIEFRISNNSKSLGLNGDSYSFTQSDENGEFEFSHENPFSFQSANKPGYLLSGPGAGFPKINAREANDATLVITPTDGIFKLVMRNNGPSNQFHVGMYSPLQDAEYGLTNGLVFRDSFYIESSMEFTRVLKVASDDTISVFWGLSKLPYDLSKLPPQGSVYVTRNDTTTFELTF